MANDQKKRGNSGKVTTREFYDAQLETNKSINTMERRILTKIDDCVKPILDFQLETEKRLAAGNEKFVTIEGKADDNKDAIDNLKLWDRGIGILSMVGTAIASYIGWKRP